MRHRCRFDMLDSIWSRRALAATPPTMSNSRFWVRTSARSVDSQIIANAVSWSELQATAFVAEPPVTSFFAAEYRPDRETSLPFTAYGRARHSEERSAIFSILEPHGDAMPSERPN